MIRSPPRGPPARTKLPRATSADSLFANATQQMRVSDHKLGECTSPATSSINYSVIDQLPLAPVAELSRGCELKRLSQVAAEAVANAVASYACNDDDMKSAVKTLRIMVCDDARATRFTAEKLLEQLGIDVKTQVQCVYAPRDVLKRWGWGKLPHTPLCKLQADVVFMDLMHPSMNGEEAVGLMRELEDEGREMGSFADEHGVYCVAMSSLNIEDTDMVPQRGLHPLGGFDAFFKKPLNKKTLLDHLCQAVVWRRRSMDKINE